MWPTERLLRYLALGIPCWLLPNESFFSNSMSTEISHRSRIYTTTIYAICNRNCSDSLLCNYESFVEHCGCLNDGGWRMTMRHTRIEHVVHQASTTLYTMRKWTFDGAARGRPFEYRFSWGKNEAFFRDNLATCVSASTADITICMLLSS